MGDSQPMSRYGISIDSSSWRAASTARRMRFAVITPSPKWASLMPTQPMNRLSVASGVSPCPMMSSVLPPPMSTTRRRASSANTL